ncbi:MAG TPA: MFS transporter, partial [Magnetospirillaceae bacterium]|nr:MFS transporter [Magnetospirillaceae bacterium]
GHNPVLALLGGDRDRGAFLSNLHVLNALVSMATFLAVAVVLGRDASVARYTVFLGVGIATGLVGSALLFRIPEPEEYRPTRASYWPSAIGEAFRSKPIRDYFLVFSIISFAAGTARTFLVVYPRAVYASGDDEVMIYTLAFSLGAVAMGMLSRSLVDRIGSKPLYGIFTAASALSLVPVILSPGIAAPGLLFAFLALLSLASGFGLAGQENAAQAYYFALIPPDRTLDLAIVYYLVFGLAGALGSATGGLALDGLAALGAEPAASYRILFSGLLALLAVALLRTRALVHLGASSVRESLGILFSLRDLRTIGLLDRLERSNRPDQEIGIIREIGQSGRAVAQKEILPYLRSPRFDVRMEALLALENLPDLGGTALKAVEEEMRNHPFTTAHLSARILGMKGKADSIPSLREALASDDYMLKGAAMVALGRQRDAASRTAIEETITTTDNPRLIIQGAYALEFLGSTASVPALVEVLRKDATPDFVRDEAVLSLAAILGVLDRFYPMYGAWTSDPERGLAMLQDALEESSNLKTVELEERARAVRELLTEPHRGASAARVLLGATGLDPKAALVLAEAAADPSLTGHRGFRFLLAMLAALSV